MGECRQKSFSPLTRGHTVIRRGKIRGLLVRDAPKNESSVCSEVPEVSHCSRYGLFCSNVKLVNNQEIPGEMGPNWGVCFPFPYPRSSVNVIISEYAHLNSLRLSALSPCCLFADFPNRAFNPLIDICRCSTKYHKKQFDQTI